MRKEGVLQAEIELLVPFFDVDMMEVVWHGHYVKYFEEARCSTSWGTTIGRCVMRAMPGRT